VPPEQAANFESQLQYYSSRFADVNEQKLRGFLKGEPWTNDKPGIILSFDDGLASHAEVAAPALEKYGFTGWFFVPADRVMATTGGSNEDGTASPDQIVSLARNHIVGSHTTTHCRLLSGHAEEKLRYEILESKAMLSAALQHEVNIFCWVGGEETTYSKAAADMIKTGYDLSFMTNNAPIGPNTNPLQLQRTNIEAENPLSLVRFQISGILDLLYLPKRRRVNKLTR
jgi:peptidoglycan/xylan/chitin deacetylase (PgdA/CDA1 family)